MLSRYPKTVVDTINVNIRKIHINDFIKLFNKLGNIYLSEDNSTIKINKEIYIKIYNYFINKKMILNRIIVGNHGIYLEFNSVDINNLKFIKKHIQYDEYRDNKYIKYYHQFRKVNYADYNINKWYIDIYDIFNIQRK